MTTDGPQVLPRARLFFLFCTISPKIFTAAIEEEVFKKLDLEERGLNKDGEMLTDLKFADDVALITVSVKDMEDQLNKVNSESKIIHKGKTK